MQRPKYTITIDPDSPDDYEISPADFNGQTTGASFTVTDRAKIRWKCKISKDFGILFKGDTPFAEMGFHGDAGSTTKFRTLVDDAGDYPYSVVIYKAEPVLHDPEIIVVDGS